jgi:3-hydroxyacyl-CoA dehydrogenase
MAGQSIAVIGNGIIGHGVTEVFAGADWRATLGATPRVSKLRSPSLERAWRCSWPMGWSAKRTDMALKRVIFGRLETIGGPDAVLASSR